jgi:hypothetical protein
VPIDIEKKPPSTQVWRWMAKVTRARNGCKDWADPQLAKKYVQFRLGRSEGETFLTELSPIPAKKATDKTWMATLKELDSNLDIYIEERRDALKRILKKNTPSMVVCYGQRADAFAELLGIEWQPSCHRVRKSADSKSLLLPFFGLGQMSKPVIEDLLRSHLLRQEA